MQGHTSNSSPIGVMYVDFDHTDSLYHSVNKYVAVRDAYPVLPPVSVLLRRAQAQTRLRRLQPSLQNVLQLVSWRSCKIEYLVV